MSPAADGVIRRLDAARQQWWLFTLLTTAVLAACGSFGLALVFMLIDALLKFSQTMLLVLFGLWLIVTAGLVVLVARRLVRNQRSLEATARRVEAELPELGSDLINVVQLSSDTRNVDRAFCGAAVQWAASRIGNVRFEEAANRETRWRRFRYCMQTPRDLGEAFLVLVALIVITVVTQLLLPNLGSAANRLMKPWTYTPSVGKAGQIKVTPGDAEVLDGASLEITAQIANPDGHPFRATLLVTPEKEKQSSMHMTADEDKRTYRVTLPSVQKAFTYRVEIGDSQSQMFRVGVRQKPTIEEVEVIYHFPSYLGRSPQSAMQKHADLEAPVYTEAELRIKPTVAIAHGHVKMDGQQFDGRLEGNQLLVVRLPLVKNTTFTVHLFNDAGHSDPQPRINRVLVRPDNPPTVELLKPARQETSAPGSEVAVSIRAGDDHGVGRVRLEMKVRDGDAPLGVAPSAVAGLPTEPRGPTEGLPAPAETSGRLSAGSETRAERAKGAEADADPPATLQEWTTFEGSTTVVLPNKLKLTSELVKPGQILMVRAKAWDKRIIALPGLDLKPQEAASPWHLIRVVDPESKAHATTEQLESLRAAIMKILETQVRARTKTVAIPQRQDAAECITLAGEVRTQQVQIQKESMALVKAIGDSAKEDRQSLRRIINALAFGDMLQAVQMCDQLVKLKTAGDFAKPVPALTATQDRIIDVLRRLLDVARKAQNEALAEMKKKAAGDLPDDTRKKLEDLKNKLEKALQQQKKVIEASENLAKKPVEDFGEEEEQLLKQLAQSQDDFSKFMKDLHSDLSRLPEQDFANPAMAKELNEIQTELKMAEDALLKKSADIAVPLEQLGYERAEEIKTNLEKWLPDTPDREKWSQEESISDQDKEAPMAELPGELEDLIGDLLEEEEDLFDEMEDVSSSAMDSIDKGAGWDVADGPISNNSAKGATGNRLPNTSEIGGRAGEGRQGKSSGEFVGDEAVGKGGRKTPSRLTPDPFVKGQIKDHSKDPTGGATGGGKESGEGGEGLEGPQSNARGPRETHRLAGKQAALRNKAEAVDLQFQVTRHHHTDVKKLLDIMAQIERDLKVGRYQNALRQRQVMAEMRGNIRQYLEGEIQSKRDTTANVPAQIQKDILGGMQDPSPTGWEEINRRYFGSVASGGGDAGAAAGRAPSAGAASAASPSPKPAALRTTTKPEK